VNTSVCNFRCCKGRRAGFYSQLLLKPLVGFGHSGSCREIHSHESNCDVPGEGPVLKPSLTEVVSDPLKGNTSRTCTYHTSAVSESQSENYIAKCNLDKHQLRHCWQYTEQHKSQLIEFLWECLSFILPSHLGFSNPEMLGQ